MKNEKELFSKSKEGFFLLNRELEQNKISLEDIGNFVPGFLHLNDKDDFSVLYANDQIHTDIGFSFEEIAEMGQEFFTKHLEQNVHESFTKRITEFYSKADNSEVFSAFQYVKGKNKENHDWMFTFSKKIEPLDCYSSLSVMVKNLGPFEKQLNGIISDDIFVRKHLIQFQSLTKREKEILSLIAQGYTSQNIADRLFISKNTVSTHRKNINKKLGIKNFRDVIKYARGFDLF